MTFEEILIEDVLVFAISGKILACEDASAIRANLKDKINSGNRGIVFDMAEVPWINSEGLGLIAAAMTSVRRAGGRLVLANINEKVEKVLTITRYITIIDCYNSRLEAVEALLKTDA